ncbi:SIR2 family protein [Listeria seeligeri]|uniref:SIR2 family protein n=1 Tax=Listeria seeligeri TaxID=1640 RepID=UPI0022EB4F86|nr:SIR2 family protein [Listeria seeligeri]
MSNNFEENLDYINDVKKNNKLIIFVGAGVSMNSGLPSWRNLIQKFANDLDYDGNIDADMLKIPQFYFDSPKFKKKYYNKIKKEIKKTTKSNSIHSIIYKLAPKHIITTNYDQLIEKTQSIEVLTNKYHVVSEDKDFLNAKTDNLIIKMHGDIDNLDSIVLKEDDYLNFSQNKILIETYIKSLMVNHTFVFIGYSIADYNFKQIINWVDAMTSNYDRNREYRSKHFLVVDSSQRNYLLTQDYLKNKNIFLLPTDNIPSDYIEMNEQKCLDLKDGIGKELFNMLSYLYDYPTSLKEKIYRICVEILIQNRISIYDLLKKCELTPDYYFDFNALGFYKDSRTGSEKTEVIRKIFSMKDKKSKVIQQAFKKSGIKEIYLVDHNLKNHETIKLTNNKFRLSPMHALELENNYVEIFRKLDSNSLEEAYYQSIFAEFEEAHLILDMKIREFSTSENHVFELVLLKQNQSYLSKLSSFGKVKFLSGNDYRKVYDESKLERIGIDELNKIYYATPSNTIEQQEWLAKHNKIYTTSYSFYLGDYMKEFRKIQTSAYNYYFYIKDNHLMLDWFHDPKAFLSIYMKAMLITYSEKERLDFPSYIYAPPVFDNYVLNLIDINILVKYSNIKTLKDYFNEYKIDMIQIEKNIPIYAFMRNLAVAFDEYPTRLIQEYFHKSMYILSKIKISKYTINRIIPQIIIFIEKQESGFSHELLNEFKLLIEAHSKQITKENKLKVIDFLFTESVLDEMVKYNKLYVINHICFKFIDILKEARIDTIKKETYYRKNIELYRCTEFLFDDNFKQEFLKLVISKLDMLNTYEMLILAEGILKKVIDFNEIVVGRLMLNINTSINSTTKTYPDWEKEAAERLCILYMNDFPVDEKELMNYSKYYPNIKLVLDPTNFDFKNIDVNNILFKEAMNNELYRKDMILIGGRVIKEKLGTLNQKNKLNEALQKLYFKYFYEL